MLGSLLCDRVLSPFSDVICYFVMDLGGLRGVSKLMAWQAVESPSSDLPVLPRILLVFDTSSPTFDENIAESRSLPLITETMQNFKQYSKAEDVDIDLKAHFHSIRVLGLNSSMSLAKRSCAFRKRILSMSEEACVSRQSTRVKFRFEHFKALSSLALEHFCSTITAPFSFIQAARPCGFSNEGFSACLRDLIEHMPSQAWLWHFVAPLVASALILSSYPPGSHRMTPALNPAN